MPQPSEILRNKFPFSPTPGQDRLMQAFDDFLENPGTDRPVLLVKGYAGTGKTTFLHTLVRVLALFNFRSLLMAPTGRAAKVMATYTGRNAYTIHKRIYRQVADPATGALEFKRQKSYYKNTVMIVDEASMLSDQADLGERNLLADLIEFAFEKENNRLILIGDAAQLPPVGQEESPGLDKAKLEHSYKLEVKEVSLTEVTRQLEGSGILVNATRVREQIRTNKPEIALHTGGTFKDIYRMNSDRLEDGLRYAYDKYGQENCILITRSNKAAVQYNRFIRQAIHFYESEIEAGDYLMIVRNNYHFLPEDSPAGFLANGDFVEVLKIRNFEDLYGFRFATLELRLIDYKEQEPFEAKVILDTLYTGEASMSYEDNRKLYNAVMRDYEDTDGPAGMKQLLRKDPYLNALQVKFAYALTCHKSQGGQWDAVFVDQGYLREDMVDKDYQRWLYTAMTRATQELFLVNFSPKFFGREKSAQ